MRRPARRGPTRSPSLGRARADDLPSEDGSRPLSSPATAATAPKNRVVRGSRFEDGCSSEPTGGPPPAVFFSVGSRWSEPRVLEDGSSSEPQGGPPRAASCQEESRSPESEELERDEWSESWPPLRERAEDRNLRLNPFSSPEETTWEGPAKGGGWGRNEETGNSKRQGSMGAGIMPGCPCYISIKICVSTNSSIKDLAHFK